jgi:hypothetical protein
MVKTENDHIRFDLQGRKMHHQRRATGHLVTVSTKLRSANRNKTSSQGQEQDSGAGRKKEKVKQNATSFAGSCLWRKKLCRGICCCRCDPGRQGNAVARNHGRQREPGTSQVITMPV